MPLTIGPDPQNPGRMIWIDAATGQPANLPTVDLPVKPSTNPPQDAPASQRTTIADLLKQQGEGWTATGNAVPKLDNDGQPVEGVYTVVLAGPNGQQRIATIYSPTSTQGPTQFTRPDADLPNSSFSIMAVEDTVKPPESTQETNAKIETAKAQAATAAAVQTKAENDLRKVQEDTREREYNQQQGNGYLTHEELRQVRQDATANNLNQQQIDARILEIGNNNRNAARGNEIAAINAATAAQNAATQAKRDQAYIEYQQGSLGLDQMKLEWQKSQDEISNRNAEAKLKLDQLTQAQANDIAQGTLAARSAELEQRKVEAAQTVNTAAQTAATQAAANVFGTERQAQTAAGTIGGNLLSNRASASNTLLNNILSGAGGLSQGSAGRYGTLGGGLQAPLPAGFGASLMSGILGTTAQQFGGQQTLDAAARMVRGAAPGAEMTPYGQTAIGVLQQAFDKYHQLAGAPHPQVAATTATTQTNTGGGLAAPVTTPQQQVANTPFGAIGSNPMLAAMQRQGVTPAQPFAQSGMAEGGSRGFTAPQGAAPTIVINA